MLLEIEKKLFQSHEKEREDKVTWVVKHIKSKPKVFFNFAKETNLVRYKIETPKNGSFTGNPMKISEILNG